jgi:hypothetical protein
MPREYLAAILSFTLHGFTMSYATNRRKGFRSLRFAGKVVFCQI